jgi:hypothetical protein
MEEWDFKTIAGPRSLDVHEQLDRAEGSFRGRNSGLSLYFSLRGILVAGFHPSLHFLMTAGGVNESGTFHRIPWIEDSRLAELFAREVLRFLVQEGLLSPG